MQTGHGQSRIGHFSRLNNNGLEFDHSATEVTILDRTGHSVWQKRKGDPIAPIRWDGIDSTGHPVDTGDYICKIVYPNEKVSYLPFVFMKR